MIFQNHACASVCARETLIYPFVVSMSNHGLPEGFQAGSSSILNFFARHGCGTGQGSEGPAGVRRVEQAVESGAQAGLQGGKDDFANGFPEFNN